MKKIGLLIFAICLSIQIYAEQVKVNVKINNHKGKQTILIVDGSTHIFNLNEEHKASIDLDLSKASWGRFKYMGSLLVVDLLLIPGKEINIEFDAKASHNGVMGKIGLPVVVKCEDEGINEFLLNYQIDISKSQLAPFSIEDRAKSSDELAVRFDEVINNELKKIDKLGTGAKYKKQLSSYIKNTVGNSFLGFAFEKMRKGYIVNYGDAYYQKIESIIENNEESAYNEYSLQYIKDAVFLISSRNTDTKAKVYTKAVNYADSLNTRPLTRMLIWKFVYECVENKGVDGTKEMRDVFEKTFADTPQAMDRFNSFIKPFLITEKGMPSPTFNFKDVNGKMVSLESLKGKYIYIDLWATWCGPCKREIPFLQKLEHAYAGKDIYFVSISTDFPDDIEKWKLMVKEKELGGIQLHIGEDKEFVKAYKVKGIPRFILLDKGGMIVDANAPRPSSPEVRELLNTLL